MPTPLTAIRLNADDLEVITELRARTGLSLASVVRLAIRALLAQGGPPSAPPKRAATKTTARTATTKKTKTARSKRGGR